MSAVVDFPVRPEARPYLDAFRPRAGEPEWLLRHRRRSLARFAELGFPSRRGEAWRYLDLRALEETPMPPAGAARLDDAAERVAAVALAEASHRLVLVDGRFAPELSALGDLPSGVWLGSIASAIAERPGLVRPWLEAAAYDAARPFAALDAALFVDGFVLDAAPGAVFDRPVEIVHIASGGGSLHTQSLIRLGAGASAAVIESYAGEGAYWRNDALALRLEPGAELVHAALVEEAEAALHFSDIAASLGRDARLAQFALLLGGRTVRREATVRIEGEGASCALHGAFLLSGREEANIVTAVDHMAPGGETREAFKGVAAGRAHGAFQGRITVRPGAQKTDAHMLSRNLLLGSRAAVDTKPELEIYADDVKCSHGAAVGDLDEAALFYLMARGIPRETARRMLIEAFLREAVEVVGPPALRRHLLARLGRRLARLEE